MKRVIFCGGLGTRLGDYHASIAKGLSEIGEQPSPWHSLNVDVVFGLNDLSGVSDFLAVI